MLSLFLTIPPKPLSSHFSPKRIFNNGDFSRFRKSRKNPNRISFPLRSSFRSNQNLRSSSFVEQEPVADSQDSCWGGDSGCVEVIGIGSRKDAVINFCLESQLQSLSSSVRFWEILSNDSQKVQLQQRSVGKDKGVQNLEVSSASYSTPCAIILVATAGYGHDHITAIKLLKAIKSAHGLAVSIILKPFSFEGQRRQDEVGELLNKLQEHSSFCIVVDTDALLRKEVVTLAEALKSANDAVSLAINSISMLMSEMHKKLFDHPRNRIKELQPQDVIEILESYEAAKVGFGTGETMKSSIVQAVYDCPFVDGDMKDLSGMVICTLSTAHVTDINDAHTLLHVFRQTAGWQHEVMVSVVHEPNLEPNMFVATIMVFGIKNPNVSKRSDFFSSLASYFPFFSFFKRAHPESEDPLSAHSIGSPCSSEDMNSVYSKDKKKMVASNGNKGRGNVYSEELGGSYEEKSDLRQHYGEDGRSEDEFLSSTNKLVSGAYVQTSEGEYALEREALMFWNVGPASRTAEEWAKERAAISGSTPMVGNQCFFTLPIGVKPTEKPIDNHYLTSTKLSEQRTSDDMRGESLRISGLPSWDVSTDASFEAVMNISNSAPTLLKGRYGSSSRKQGLLSSRAASMLEAERDTQKRWNPVVEMPYQGGIYKGRCQGGLPEGKGHLALVDGSIYDGMWRYGKRSGMGTLYYSNGDVFQGSWRDDLMHGKGWFYFHTGDRLFANFWKGKANGEGRFYSKDGEIFFGNFQDGWRHGQSLCIDKNGARWAEVWDEGVLLSRQQLDSGASS